jgi:simple sugar transport system ATP-binding protein
VTEFFGIVRSLRDAGKALVFITHKLHEVIEVADRINVLRAGKVVGERDPKAATEAELAEMMVGRAVSFDVDKQPAKPGRALLEVSGLAATNERHELAVRGVDLTVREGEVVGVAGVQGNGQTELVEALTGLRMPVHGNVTFLGRDITRDSARQRHLAGIAHIPEDRQRDGMVGEFDIAENMVLDSYYDAPFSQGLSMDWAAVHKVCVKNVIDFDVRTPSIYSLADHLSGGNQQKLIVAREPSRDVKLVIAAQPTRGIDVGSIEYIHRRIIEARDRGVGVLIVSTELDEILALSDRILVMFRGRIAGTFKAGEVSMSEIGLAMAGAGAAA